MIVTSIEVATARDANPSGSMFGGWLMQLADRIGSVAASRYCERRVATASIDMRFIAPCYVGEFLTVTAEVISSATTSMTVALRIDADGVRGAEMRNIVEGRLVFVALSDSGMPVPIRKTEPLGIGAHRGNRAAPGARPDAGDGGISDGAVRPASESATTFKETS
jgi:acyl-CoA thioesterase YciA